MTTILRRNAPSDIDVHDLIREGPADFRVNGLVYTDRDVFDLEMDRIFGASWVYVAHDSEIPNPGDFRTAYIGRRPVIVSRGDDGGINVLLNRCRHRGSVVCRDERGTAKEFRCRYHGWLYANNGELIGIAHHRGGYPDDIDKGALGLRRAPRVDSYRGLIFASMKPSGDSLADHLGPARRYIDLQFDRSPVGRVRAEYGAHRSEYRGNWKFQAENTTDGYHGDTVHESFWRVLAEFGHAGGRHGAYTQQDMRDIIRHRQTGRTLGFENGHGMLEYPIAEDAVDAMRRGAHAAYMGRLEKTHGRAALGDIFNQMNVLVFPNLGLLHGQIRVIRPVAVDRTEVSIQFYALEGAPDAYNDERLGGYERFFGPAAFGSPDDVEIFAMNQTGLQAREVEWLLLRRGIERETRAADGTRTGDPTDETPQRAFHRMWKRLMAA